MLYAKIALPLPIDRLFDYSLPADITGEIIGRRALVNFAGRGVIGYIADTAEKTSIPKVKSVLKVIDSAPILNQPLLKLARIISDYYCCSLGEAFNTILPPGIRKGLAVNILEQKTAIPRGQAQGFKMDFVRGDSLEIRMRAYLPRISRAIETKKSVVFLSPEINAGKRIHNLLKIKIRRTEDGIYLSQTKPEGRNPDLGTGQKLPIGYPYRNPDGGIRPFA